jgi:hypothetical protein
VDWEAVLSCWLANSGALVSRRMMVVVEEVVQHRLKVVVGLLKVGFLIHRSSEAK